MTRVPASWTATSIAAVIAAAAGFWGGKVLTPTVVRPQVMSGIVGLVGVQGDEFTFRSNGTGPVTGYGLPGPVQWRNSYGVWFDTGRPACMRPLSHGQHIRLGVVSAAPVADAPGGPVIVWLECPTKSIPRYPIVTPSAGRS
jgi:hypothetical protein